MINDNRKLIAVLVVMATALLAVASLRMTIQGGWSTVFPDYLTSEERANLAGVASLKFGAVIQELIVHAPLIVGLWLAAAGFGGLLRRAVAPAASSPVAIDLTAGMAVLLILNWLIAWAGLLNRVTGIALILIGAAFCLAHLARRPQTPPPRINIPWTLIAFGPALGMLAALCFCPPGTIWKVEAWGYDVLSYHLQLPKEWLDAGRMSGLHHNVYSYLPGLGETGYMLLGAIKGSAYKGIYAAQLFHASAAIVAAATLGRLVARYAGAAAGVVAGAVFLTMPWSIITASMAYNEMFAMAFGAGAMLITLDDAVPSQRRGILAGLLVGAATLAKLTIGGVFALAVACILLVQHRSWRAPAFAAVVGIATLAPWLLRNGLDTGNPVFPFATQSLGRGHWSPLVAERWEKGHRVDDPVVVRLAALGEQWLTNTGYGTLFAAPRTRVPGEIESRNIARFDTHRGFPLFWIAVAIAAILCLCRSTTRRPAAAMIVLLLLQLAFWLTATHLQSRFLIPTLLPACVLLGMAATSLPRPRTNWIIPLLLLAMSIWLATTTYRQIRVQSVGGNVHGKFVNIPLWDLIYTLPTARMMENPNHDHMGQGDHIINTLPPETRTLLIADNSRLLYIRRPIVYQSAFDVDPLGDIIRRVGFDPPAVTQALKDAGITHVWIHLGELDRLRNTYGYDPDVTIDRTIQLLRTWRPVWHDKETGSVHLLELP